MKRVSEDKEEIWVKRGCVRDGNVLRFTNWHAVEKKKAVDFVTKRNGWGYQDSGFFFSKQVQQVKKKFLFYFNCLIVLMIFFLILIFLNHNHNY